MERIWCRAGAPAGYHGRSGCAGDAPGPYAKRELATASAHVTICEILVPSGLPNLMEFHGLGECRKGLDKEFCESSLHRQELCGE